MMNLNKTFETVDYFFLNATPPQLALQGAWAPTYFSKPPCSQKEKFQSVSLGESRIFPVYFVQIIICPLKIHFNFFLSEIASSQFILVQATYQGVSAWTDCRIWSPQTGATQQNLAWSQSAIYSPNCEMTASRYNDLFLCKTPCKVQGAHSLPRVVGSTGHNSHTHGGLTCMNEVI